MNKKRVNSITYGALICALTGAFLLLNRQLGGMFNTYMLWIIPLPVIIYCLKFDVRQGFVMGFAMLLLSFIVATPVSTFYVFASIIAGLVYADGVKKEKSSLQLIVSVIMVSLFILVVTSISLDTACLMTLSLPVRAPRPSLNRWRLYWAIRFWRTHCCR